MILDALYIVLNPIVPAFPLIGDQVEATPPFQVFEAIPSPVRTKDGIVGYLQQVSIYVIDNDLDRLDENVDLIHAAVVAMNREIGGTYIEDVLLTDASGSYYDAQTGSFRNDLEFRFDTKNR